MKKVEITQDYSGSTLCLIIILKIAQGTVNSQEMQSMPSYQQVKCR